MILLSIILMALIIALVMIIASGGAVLLVFGDVIVCVALITLIIKAISKRKE